MRPKQIESRKQSSPNKCYKDKGPAQESNLDLNFLNYQFAKYHTTKYIKIIPPHDDISGPKLQLEVEGRWINSRGKSKDITYFECASHRHVNAPDCGFRARIKNFDSSANEGDIYIISEHDTLLHYPDHHHGRNLLSSWSMRKLIMSKNLLLLNRKAKSLLTHKTLEKLIYQNL